VFTVINFSVNTKAKTKWPKRAGGFRKPQMKVYASVYQSNYIADQREKNKSFCIAKTLTSSLTILENTHQYTDFFYFSIAIGTRETRNILKPICSAQGKKVAQLPNFRLLHSEKGTDTVQQQYG